MEERSAYWRLSGRPLGLFFAAVMIMVAGQRWYAARDDLAGDLTSLAGIIGTNASAALVFDDGRAAAEILTSLAHYPVVTEAALLRKDGTVLAAYRSARQGNDAEAPLPGAGPAAAFSLRSVQVATPVSLHGDGVGTVAIRASQRSLYLSLGRFVAGFVAIGAFAFLLARLATGKLRRRTLQSEAERRKAEDAQRESERRLRSVTDHLPIALFQLTAQDDALRFGYVSDGAAALLGLSAGDLTDLGEVFFARIHRDDRPALETELRRETNDGLPAVVWQGRFQKPPGDEIWLEIRCTRGGDADGAAVVSGVMQDVTQLRRYQLEIEQSRARLRELIVHRENLVDEVHKKIAIEIHDQLGQIITAALLHLRLLDRTLAPTDEASRELVRNVDELLNDAYRSMKDIAVSLRPAVLNFGFVAAAEWLAERVLGVAGIAWRIETSEPPPRLDERQSVAFFRIIQESLNNCVRHANASEVRISLTAQHDQLVLEIADDGKGMGAAAGEEKQFGVLGMKERAESLGGTATFGNTPNGGTTVTVTVPAAVP